MTISLRIIGFIIAAALLPACGKVQFVGGPSSYQSTAIKDPSSGEFRSVAMVSLKINPETIVLKPGDGKQFKAIAIFSDGSQRDVTGEANWSAAREDVGTVDNDKQKGRFTALTEGDEDLFATFSPSAGQNYKASAKIAIKSSELALARLDLKYQNKMFKGQSQTIQVMAVYSDGSSRDVTPDAQYVSRSGTILGCHAGGVVDALAIGDDSVDVVFEKIQDTAAIQVVDYKVTNLVISPPSKTMTVGESVQFTVVGTLEQNAGSIDLTTQAKWSSSQSSTLQVGDSSNKGFTQALLVGNASVIVEYNGLTASAPVAVSAPRLIGLEIIPTPTNLNVSQSMRLMARAKYADNSFADVTFSAAASWSSAQPSLVSMGPAGWVTGVAAGSASVSVAFGGLTANASVRVSTAAPTCLDLQAPTSVVAGQAFSLQVSAGGSVNLINFQGVGNNFSAVAYASPYTVTVSNASVPGTYYYTAMVNGPGGQASCPMKSVVVYVPQSNNFLLSVSKSGSGSVLSLGVSPSINCGSICSQSYAQGTRVDLQATADQGSSFAGWGGDCAAYGSSPTCTVYISNHDASVTATFTAIPIISYGLTVNKTSISNGTGTVMSSGVSPVINCGASCFQNYTQGTSVKLTATADSDSSFAGWSGDCSAFADNGQSCVVNMTQPNRIVTATFVKNAPSTYALIVNKTGSAASSWVVSSSGVSPAISCGSVCSQNYNKGTFVTLSATAGNFSSGGSTFTGWSGGGCSGTGSCTVTLNSMTTVSANFDLQAPATYSLTINKTGAAAGIGFVSSSGSPAINCGTICSISVTAGTAVTLTATPGNSIFTGWSGGGCSGTGTCVVTVNGSTNISANFDLKPVPTYLLAIGKTGTAAGIGVVSSSGSPAINCGTVCSISVTAGTAVTLTATPGNSIFTGWSGGGCSGTGTCVVTVNSTTNVSANFDLKPVPTYLLTINKTGAAMGLGTVSSSGSPAINCGTVCSISVTSGTSVTLTAAPGGSIFTGWSGGGCSGTGTCVVTVNGPMSVSANFDLKPVPSCNLSVSKDTIQPGQSVTVSLSSDTTYVDSFAIGTRSSTVPFSITETLTQYGVKTYEASVSNSRGTSTCSLDVTVASATVQACKIKMYRVGDSDCPGVPHGWVYFKVLFGTTEALNLYYGKANSTNYLRCNDPAVIKAPYTADKAPPATLSWQGRTYTLSRSFTNPGDGWAATSASDWKTGDCTVSSSYDSPLMLDLEDKPIELSSQSNGTQFDLTGDGDSHRYSWPKHPERSVFLAYDKNDNGAIDSVNELFGDNTVSSDGTDAANGFEALKKYDLNGDGVIDARDPIFAHLSVWYPYSDGGQVRFPAKLRSLVEVDIESINLKYINQIENQDAYGNESRQHSVVTLKGGRTLQIFDMWFSREP